MFKNEKRGEQRSSQVAIDGSRSSHLTQGMGGSNLSGVSFTAYCSISCTTDEVKVLDMNPIPSIIPEQRQSLNSTFTPAPLTLHLRECLLHYRFIIHFVHDRVVSRQTTCVLPAQEVLPRFLQSTMDLPRIVPAFELWYTYGNTFAQAKRFGRRDWKGRCTLRYLGQHWFDRLL